MNRDLAGQGKLESQAKVHRATTLLEPVAACIKHVRARLDERAATGISSSWIWIPAVGVAVLVVGLTIASILLLRQVDRASASLVGAAERYREGGANQGALRLLNQAVDLGIRDTQVLGRAGNLYRLLGRYETAVDLLERAVAREPDRADYRLNLARSYVGAGRPREAVAQCELLAARGPDLAGLHLALGGVYEDLRIYDRALAHYARSAELEPDTMDGYYAQGQLYRLKLAQYGPALEQYRLGLLAAPGDPYAYLARVHLGTCLAEEGEYRRATIQFRIAMSLYPDYSSAYYYLGKAYAAQGQFADARMPYERAVELNPGYVSGRLALATTYLELGDCPNATAQFQEVLALSPGHLDAQMGLARCPDF